MTEKYVFGPITVDNIKAAESLWSEITDEDLFYLEYNTIIEWAASHLHEKCGENAGDSVAYGVFESATGNLVAVVDVVFKAGFRPKDRWVKMLKVNLSPLYSEYELAQNPAKLDDVIDIHFGAIRGTIELTGVQNAKIVKLYGRNENLMLLLTGINKVLNERKIAGYDSAMHGRWLVLEAN